MIGVGGHQQQAKREKEPQTNLRGPELLDNPTLSKGTAFTPEERREYGLEGLLPHAVETIDRRLDGVMERLDAKPTDLERYIYSILTSFFHMGLLRLILQSSAEVVDRKVILSEGRRVLWCLATSLLTALTGALRDAQPIH